MGHHAQQLEIVLAEERQHRIIEEIRRLDWRLSIVQLGASDLRIGIDLPGCSGLPAP